MGATNFIEFGKGKTAEQAFNTLVEQAEREYGNGYYNGTISTTALVKPPVRNLADKWSDETRDKAIAYAIEHNWGEKWESRAIHCGECGDGLHMWAFYGWAAC